MACRGRRRETTVTVTLDFDERAIARLESGFAVGPSATYFWMRDFFFRTAVAHRVGWLRRKGVRFGRRDVSIKVPRVNEAGNTPDSNVVVYRVLPQARRIRGIGPARQGLRELLLSIHTRSDVLRSHEFGAKIRPRRGTRLAIPIAPTEGGRRTRFSPREFRARHPKAVLIARRSRKGGAIILFERVRKRAGVRTRMRRTKTGKLTRSQPKTKVDRLIPRWALITTQTIRPRLRFYDTWDSNRGDRDRAFSRAADRLLKDLARGITT